MALIPGIEIYCRNAIISAFQPAYNVVFCQKSKTVKTIGLLKLSKLKVLYNF